MIVGLIGTPSPLTYIAIHLLRAIVQVVHGDHHMLGVNTVADLREAWPKQDQRKPAVVLASDMPSPDYVGFLLGANVPLVLCIEPVDDIVRYMVACRAADGLSAIRVATQSLSNLEALATDGPPALLRFGAFNATLAETISALLRFCHQSDDDDQVQRVVAYLAFADRPHIVFSEFLDAVHRSLFPNFKDALRLGPEEGEAIQEVSRGYGAIAAGRRLQETYWPAYCFFVADTPGISVQDEFSLEGKARFLSYGPYLFLPPGLWSVEVEVEVFESLSENRVGFDVTAGKLLVACTSTLPSEGALACDMVFRVVEANVPIEIRMQLLTGAIEGKLRLRGAALRRL